MTILETVFVAAIGISLGAFIGTWVAYRIFRDSLNIDDTVWVGKVLCRLVPVNRGSKLRTVGKNCDQSGFVAPRP
jgi:hypothetical protein